jgi:hypothetical protein
MHVNITPITCSFKERKKYFTVSSIFSLKSLFPYIPVCDGETFIIYHNLCHDESTA